MICRIACRASRSRFSAARGLLHIIDQLNLYADPHSQPSPDQKVDRMRKEIEIELVRDARNQITAFNVSYSSRDPHLAQQVTSELTNLFINENLEVRQQQSEDTTKFLESQLEAARKTLSDQEEKIRQFKAQHVGELPAQVGSNLQILAGLAVSTANRRRRAEYRQATAGIPRNPGESVPLSARHAEEFRHGAPAVGLPAIDRGVGKAQGATGGSQLALHRPPSRRSQGQAADRRNRKDQRPNHRGPEGEEPPRPPTRMQRQRLRIPPP